MFWLRNKKNNFQLRTIIWGHVSEHFFEACGGPAPLFAGMLKDKMHVRILRPAHEI